MSSEGSVSTSSSSRIRQFGLYRTIDARTEEFLRLSRKRQIKQGCACAAVSTAITVTVVITVFLVYMEYGINTDANPQSLGRGWIGLINDSLATTFEEKFSKSKINFDRSTIKLLPIIIKALKQNRYLEKIIEDYSSPSPVYEGKVTTEFSFKKDIFLNTKTWMKKPTSRLYAIEYKTSPIVFIKNPTKEPGYFTKKRKIRDYKRIMEYVEKMINDKVGLGFTVPMTNKVPETQTEKISKNQVTYTPKVTLNKKFGHIKKKPSISERQKHKQEDVVSCKCPKQLSLLLDKILTSIQQLLPDDKTSKSAPCSEDRHINATESNPDTVFYPPKTIFSTTTKKPLHTDTKFSTVTKQQSFPVLPLQFSEFGNIYHTKKTDKLPEKSSTTPVNLSQFSNIKLSQTNRLENFDSLKSEKATLPSVFPTSNLPFLESKNVLLNSKNFSIWENRDEKGINYATTPVYNYIKPTEGTYDTTITTQPMKPTVDVTEREQIRNESTTEKSFDLETDELYTLEDENEKLDNKILNRNISSQNTLHSDTFSLQNIKQLKNKKKDHITTTLTTPNVLKAMNEFNILSYELLKSKLVPPTKRFNSTVKYPSNSIVKQFHNTSKDNDESTTISPNEMLMTTALPQFYSVVSKTMTDESSAVNNASKTTIKTKAIFPYYKANTTKNISAEQESYKQEPLGGEFYSGLENPAFEDDIEKLTHDDDYPEEDYLKRTETKYKPTAKNVTQKLQDMSAKDFWQILKNNERFFGSNSMLLENRPTYLEINRNDWKHEDNKDYDTDMKYNIFDLL